MSFKQLLKKPLHIILLISFILRTILAYLHTVAGDACYYFTIISQIAETYKFPTYLFPQTEIYWWNPPAFYVISAPFYKFFSFFGIEDFGPKLVSVIFSIGIIYLGYKITEKISNEKTALWVTAFIAFLPLNIAFSYNAYTDSTVTFFCMLTMYLLLNKKSIFLSSLSFGLALLTKFTAVVMIPIILYLIFRISTKKIKKLTLDQIPTKKIVTSIILFFMVSLIIASPMYIRNYKYEGNPFFPYMGFMFGENGRGINFADLINIDVPIRFYLTTIGIPNGSYNLEIFDSMFGFLALIGYSIMGLIFLLPILFFRIKDVKKNIKDIWFLLVLGLSYLCLLLFYGISGDEWIDPRFALAAVIIPAILWGLGMQNIIKTFKNKKIKRLIFFALISIIIVFVTFEIGKTIIATKLHSQMNKDFNWIENNLDSNQKFDVENMCFVYRSGLYKSINPNKADYIIITKYDTNDNANLTKIYNNPKTDIKIYKSHK